MCYNIRNFWGGSMDKINSIYRHKISKTDYILIEQIEDLFKCNMLYGNKYLSYDYILNTLKLDEDYLDRLLCIMQIHLGMLGRKDFINKSVSYELLPEVYYDSKWSRIYEEFKSNESLKKVLLISDTHIGNEDIYNQKIIDNIYEYAVKNNVNCIIHLGDLFDGIKDYYPSDYMKEFERQLSLFEKYYPNMTKEGIMTYLLKGNHDESMENILERDGLDLRVLNYLNKSFYMFPKRSQMHRYSHQTLDINNFKIKMTHEAYASTDIINTYASDDNINSILDFDKIDGSLNRIYNLLISGHRHEAMVTNYTNSDCSINNLYLTVPSTSNLNIDKCCGLLIDFNYNLGEVHDIDITSLYCDSSYSIKENESLNYDYSKEQKLLVKKL